jgi:hypothetical protein
VTDPTALDTEEGARAFFSVELPQSWLDDGAEVELLLPKRLVCARCEGGGCDACGRSGALRAPEEEEQRKVRVHLPHGVSQGTRIRLVDPFEDGSIAQLHLELRAGELAPGATRVDALARLPRAVWLRWAVLLVVLVLAVALLAVC